MKISKVLFNIILTVSIGILILYFGLFISFVITKFLPGDIVLGYLISQGIHSPTPAQYQMAYQALGLDLPLIVQFLRYLLNMRLGDFGVSFAIASGTPVAEFLGTRVPRMIEFSLLPLLIGLALGVILGRVASRNRNTWKDKIIKLVTSFGFAIPVFFFGMIIQYQLGFKAGLIPASGYKTMSFPDPQHRTGFLILDSFLDGQLYLAMDIFYHYLAPRIIFMIAIIALTTWQTRSYMARKSHEKTAISNTSITAIIFGTFFAFYLLIDVTFNLRGFGDLLVDAIIMSDHFVVAGLLTSLFIIFVVVMFISNFIFVLCQFLASRGVFERLINRSFLHRIIKPKPDDSLYEQKGRDKTGYKKLLKDYVITRIKSPYFIIGGILVVFFIVVVNFPLLFTQYTFSEANGIFMGAWEPPSPGHPLGTADFGRDVLARIIYGARDSIIVGVTTMLIGLIVVLVVLAILIAVILSIILIVGLIRGSEINFEFITTKLKRVLKKFDRWGYTPIMGLMIAFYLFPGLVIALLMNGIFGLRLEITMLVIGVLFIPSFVKVIANEGLRSKRIWNIVKALIRYIPLSIALAILIYNTIGFLGFGQPTLINLGSDISRARLVLFMASHASFWPGLMITGIIGSFLLFHIGLQDRAQKERIVLLKEPEDLEELDL
ncbi:MAG: ABC transporter permease subunit [Promethearchaeota archaeon]|jgi:peptide/nickel transport system permease protein